MCEPKYFEVGDAETSDVLGSTNDRPSDPAASSGDLLLASPKEGAAASVNLFNGPSRQAATYGDVYRDGR
jgi:hypothetical protein